MFEPSNTVRKVFKDENTKVKEYSLESIEKEMEKTLLELDVSQ